MQFRDIGDHGQHHLQASVAGGPEEGADLGPEEVGTRETEADASQSEKRIVLAIDRKRFGRFVAADVERPDDDRIGGKKLKHGPIGLILLVFGRKRRAVDEQEFRAEQADAHRAGFSRALGVGKAADVRRHDHRDPVLGDGTNVGERRQRGGVGLRLGRGSPKVARCDRVRVGKDFAGLTVESEGSRLPEFVDRSAEAEHGGQTRPAREDRRVTRGGPSGGDKPGDRREVRMAEIRGRDVVGHDDGGARNALQRQGPLALKLQRHEPGGGAHVLRPRSRILVGERAEFVGQFFAADANGGDGRFPLADDGGDRFRPVRILDDLRKRQQHVAGRRVLRGCSLPPAPHGDRRLRPHGPFDLRLDPVGRDVFGLRINLRLAEDEGRTQAEPRAHGDTDIDTRRGAALWFSLW